MHEAFVVEGDADVQFLAGKMHEYEIAGCSSPRATGDAVSQLLAARCAARGCRRRPRHRPPGRCSRSRRARLRHSGRVVRAWTVAEIDHDLPPGLRRARRRTSRRAGWLAKPVLPRGRRTGRETTRDGGAEARSAGLLRSRADSIHSVVANAAPTMPASERSAPTHSGASQCSLSMNFSGSSVMPPHSTMRSGQSSACISLQHLIQFVPPSRIPAQCCSSWRARRRAVPLPSRRLGDGRTRCSAPACRRRTGRCRCRCRESAPGPCPARRARRRSAAPRGPRRRRR